MCQKAALEAIDQTMGFRYKTLESDTGRSLSFDRSISNSIVLLRTLTPVNRIIMDGLLDLDMD